MVRMVLLLFCCAYLVAWFVGGQECDMSGGLEIELSAYLMLGPLFVEEQNTLLQVYTLSTSMFVNLVVFI